MSDALVGEPMFAPYLEHNRNAIVGIALDRSVARERHTVLADALCNRCIDHLIAAMEERDDASMLGWVSSSLHGPAREQALFALFTSTVSAALDVLIRDFNVDDSTLRWLEHLQQRIDVTVSASRLDLYEERFSFDSIDAKIDEVLYKLAERDTISAEHSRAVGMWCSRIAKKMGLSRDEALLASRSGLIHDIGKISTPLEILTAPRSLTADEWVVMRRHTLDGVEAVQGVKELQDLVPAVRWHHERMDGRGYPDQLDGDSIPLTARIVSVADAFNAMVARRPYRKPLSPSVALEELKRNSGTHFDASVINAMTDVVSQ